MSKFDKASAFIYLSAIVICIIACLIFILSQPFKGVCDTLYLLIFAPIIGFFVGTIIIPTVFLWLFWNVVFPVGLSLWLIYWIVYYPINKFIVWIKYHIILKNKYNKELINQ